MRKTFLVLLVISFVEFSAQDKSKEVLDFFNDASNKIYAESNGFYFLDIPKKKELQRKTFW